MNIFLVIVCNLVLLLSFFVYRKIRNFNTLELDVWTSILLIALLPTIVGANFFLLSYYEMDWGLQEYLNENIIRLVFVEYYVSWCILFLLFGFGKTLISIPDRSYDIESWKRVKNKNLFDIGVITLFILIIIYDLYLIRDLPFFYILDGDIIGAEEAKGRFFDARMTSSIPMIGYLMQYFPLFALGWTFDRYLNSKKILGFMIVLIFLIIYSGLTLIKSYALMPFIVAFLVYFSYKKNKINFSLAFKTTFVGLLVILLPFSLLAEEFNNEVFFNIVERIFMVQIQGAFLIRSLFDGFEISALLEGAPLLKRFGFETMDPASEVFRMIWGEQAFLDGFVNINSHFIGQGFVMFGHSIVVVGPIFIFLNAVLLTLCYRFFLKSPFRSIAAIVLLTSAALIPINNNFGNTVYFKSLLGMIFLMITIAPIYFASTRLSLNK